MTGTCAYGRPVEPGGERCDGCEFAGPGPAPCRHPRPAQAARGVVEDQAAGDDQEDRAVFLVLGGKLTGAELLNHVHDVLTKYVIFPVAEAPDAVTLWIAATHAQPAWECAARLQIRSPLKRCGKSRLLDLVENLSADPLLMVLATPAALFRSIGDEEPPTLLLDEADTIFGTKDKSESQEAIRGILNAGHQRGRMIPRCVPPTHEVRQFPTFAMAALAGIGSLPDTIEDRSVIVELHRRAPGETVAKLRWRRVKPGLKQLHDQLHAWARGCLDQLREADPELPVDDRAADTWEPLIVIADAAGGDWPDRARKACKVLSGKAAASESDVKMSVRLLADLRDIFTRNEPNDRAHTEALLGELRKIGESPWHDYYGHPLDARDMANLLREYGVKSKDVWIDGVTKKGYRTADLWDSWQRYLPEPEGGSPPPPVRQDELSADPGGGGPWSVSPYPNARSARSARRGADQGIPPSVNSPCPLGPLGDQETEPVTPCPPSGYAEQGQGADLQPRGPSGPSPTPWPNGTTDTDESWVRDAPDDLDDGPPDPRDDPDSGFAAANQCEHPGCTRQGRIYAESGRERIYCRTHRPHSARNTQRK